MRKSRFTASQIFAVLKQGEAGLPVAESFFHLLKRERTRRSIYAIREQARADIFDYIEMFYSYLPGKYASVLHYRLDPASGRRLDSQFMNRLFFSANFL